jgi:hypothetical protein
MKDLITVQTIKQNPDLVKTVLEDPSIADKIQEEINSLKSDEIIQSNGK